MDLLKELGATNPDVPMLVRLVDGGLRQLDIRELDWRIARPPIRAHDPSSASFYRSVPLALAHLKAAVSELPRASESDAVLSVIGYSHVDTCWLWPFSLMRFKTTNTAASMLHLLEQPPHDVARAADWVFRATSAQHCARTRPTSTRACSSRCARALGGERRDVGGGRHDAAVRGVARAGVRQRRPLLHPHSACSEASF
jgi:hypothetical protein